MTNIFTKKRVRNILAGLLLIVLLLNVLDLTGAKYKTKSETVADNARVAHWISGTSISLDLFKSSYASEDPALAGANSVQSHNGDKVIAPGTTGSYTFSPKIEGNAPEVAYKMGFNAEAAYTGDWNIDSAAYLPVKFSLEKNVDQQTTNIVKEVSLDELITALNNEGETTNFEANQLPTELSYNIIWNWPYSTSEENDLKDTILATRSLTGALSVNLSAAMSVEQLD